MRFVKLRGAGRFALLSFGVFSSTLIADFGSGIGSSAIEVARSSSAEPAAPLRIHSDGAPAAPTRVASSSLLGLAEHSAEFPEKVVESRSAKGLLPTDNRSRPEADIWLGIVGKEAVIRMSPERDSEVLGMARMGMLLRRSAAPTGTSGCAGGWYAVAPRGHVCASGAATLDLEHPVLGLASLEADRSEPLPYRYGRSRTPAPAFYTRVPTPSEQRDTERDLGSHLPKNFGRLWGEGALGAAPGPLLDGQPVPGRPKDAIATGYARARSAFAFLDLFESEGRRFGLTTDFSVIPLDRLEPVRASEFRGVELTEQRGLPLAFVKNSSSWVYGRDEKTGALSIKRKAGYREAFHVEEERAVMNGLRFLRTKDGHYIRDSDDLVLIREPERLPKWAHGTNPWLSVSLLRQTLVAFRGDKAVYATLVSTGAGGIGDPLETNATVQGVFRIHTKHITKTMAGDEADDPFDLRDVPYVQYFHEGYALHAAFWHDAFGQPKSHGCINLSPKDARHLFHLTEPAVPSGWHSALSRHGTILWIHP